jgi:hypothetical protein
MQEQNKNIDKLFFLNIRRSVPRMAQAAFRPLLRIGYGAAPGFRSDGRAVARPPRFIRATFINR